MSSALYSIYVKNNLDLARTLVVKSDMAIDAINSSLREVGIYIDETDPTSWKYYKNIAGEYHFTDQIMEVVSVDTLETIQFTKDNLRIHRATAKEYAYGTRYYNDLVRKFPDQEMLIKGILNPVDMPRAIAAENGTVLYYNTSLVDTNEDDLIPRIERWIKSFMIRWNVPAYAITDDLYVPVFLGIMYTHLPGVIANIRLDNCHTNRAHSYHIREFLASHGKLDVYMDLLTQKQSLWLYRNIRYIYLNVGKQETFELLVSRILTDRGFPLASYEMRHNLENQPGEVLPEVEMVQKPINLRHLGGRDDRYTPYSILTKEIPLAKGNADAIGETEADINRRMKHSAISTLATKVLESTVVDLSDDGPFRFSDVLLQNWIYLSANERYVSVISFTNPSNGEVFRLSARDAFIVFLYAFNKALGMDFEKIPKITAFNVRKIPAPNFAELRAITEEKYVSDDFINSVLADLPPIGVYINPLSFNEACVEIHKRLVLHRYQYTSIEHMVGRGQAEAAAMHVYAHIPCQLTDEEDMDMQVWLNDRGLDFDALTQYDFDLMAIEIAANATGTSLNASRSLRELQEGMLRLMGQLSSYMVQYISTINTEPYVVIDWSAIRTGDWNQLSKGSFYAPGMAPRVMRIDNKSLTHINYDLVLRSEDFQYHVSISDHINYSVPMNIEADGRPTYEIDMLDMVGVRVLDAESDSVNLDVLIPNNDLSGFNYL